MRARASFVLLALVSGLAVPALRASSPGSEAQDTALPTSLERALARRDPFALADTTLPRLSQLDAARRAVIAQRLATWKISDRVAAWAFLQVGMRYELGPLGEEAPPDTQPVIAFTTTDCTVMNLTAAALAHAQQAGGERAAMAHANYRDGAIAYTTRFHFTTDRLDSSPYFRDITQRVGGSTARHRTITLNHRKDGGRWVPIVWERRRELYYLPRAWAPRFAAAYAQGRIPAAMGVGFVDTALAGDGLDVVHESLLWKGRTLLHASSRTGRVVTLPLMEYLEGPGRGFDGFVLFEYR